MTWVEGPMSADFLRHSERPQSLLVRADEVIE
jgi:hypothetical protein